MNANNDIAALLAPCSPPDIAAGFDLCPCGRGGSWPCAVTKAAWLARGLDPTAEVRRICRTIHADWTAEEEGWR